MLVGSALSAAALVWLVFRTTPFEGGLGFVLCWIATFAFVYWLVERDLHGSLAASDRVASVLIASAAVAVIVPLVTIIVFVVVRGARYLRLGFFTETLANAGPDAAATEGGALHSIVGTFMQVGIAMLISVPLGVLAAVFLNEIGGRFARPVRGLVDAMSGVPSIVAGLFIYAVVLIQFGTGFMGFAGGLALSVLMLPSVIRTSEEVLRLVPDGLREASLALGAPQWRTVSRVVLPTARAGLITAVLLGVARAVGETAPLIMTSFNSFVTNVNPFEAAQSSLPMFVFTQVRSSSNEQVNRAWAGALVLITLVLLLFTLARTLGRSKFGKPKRRLLRRRVRQVHA